MFISHGDALEDAEYVRDLIRERFGFQNFLIWLSYNLFLAVILAAVAVVAVVVGRRELKKRRNRNGPDNKTE